MNCDCNQGRLACSCASSEEPVKSLYMQIERGEVEGMRARIAELEGALSWHEEQPRCGVVLPERMPEVFGNRYPNAVGWNDCLTEVARLNPPGETLAALPDVETSTVLHSAWLRLAGDGQPSVDDLKRYYLAISAALIDLSPPGAGVYSADPMACSGCAGGCFRCAKTGLGECVPVPEINARVIAYTPGEGKIELYCGAIPQWLELGETVTIQAGALLAQQGKESCNAN